MLHEHQSNSTDRSSYKINSCLMLEWWWFYCTSRLLNLHPCSAILVTKNWQKYAYTVGKLYPTFCLTASMHPLPWSEPFHNPFKTLMLSYMSTAISAVTSQNPSIKSTQDAEKLSLEGSFMPYLSAHQCEDICPPLPVLIPTSQSQLPEKTCPLWEQEGNPFFSQTISIIVLITMSPSVLHIHLLSSVLHKAWKVLGECITLGDSNFVMLQKSSVDPKHYPWSLHDRQFKRRKRSIIQSHWLPAHHSMVHERPWPICCCFEESAGNGRSHPTFSSWELG